MTKPSDGAVAAVIVLGVIAGLLWLLHLATVASLGRSDAAGDAIGEAYAAIELIALWSLLTIMTVIASFRGSASRPAQIPYCRPGERREAYAAAVVARRAGRRLSLNNSDLWLGPCVRRDGGKNAPTDLPDGQNRKVLSSPVAKNISLDGHRKPFADLPVVLKCRIPSGLI